MRKVFYLDTVVFEENSTWKYYPFLKFHDDSYPLESPEGINQYSKYILSSTGLDGFDFSKYAVRKIVHTSATHTWYKNCIGGFILYNGLDGVAASRLNLNIHSFTHLHCPGLNIYNNDSIEVAPSEVMIDYYRKYEEKTGQSILDRLFPSPEQQIKEYFF